MRFLPLLLLAACNRTTVDTERAVIETRGWPVVAVHVEGPGGDRMTVPFEVVAETAYVVDPDLVAVIFSLLTIALLCYILNWTFELGKR